MSTILQKIHSNREVEDIRKALEGIGCDVCSARTLSDLKKVVEDQAVAGSKVVVNGSIEQGTGVIVTPIDKSGYRISATAAAPITNTIGTYPKGTPIQEVLSHMVTTLLPQVTKDAMQAPSIAKVDMFKSMADGIDYYSNPAFGRDGAGRSQVHPNTWYIRFFLHSQAEPLYLSLSPVVEDLKSDIINEVMHRIDGKTAPIEKPKCNCSMNIDDILNGK